MQTKGDGVKNQKTFANIIYGCPLVDLQLQSKRWTFYLKSNLTWICLPMLFLSVHSIDPFQTAWREEACRLPGQSALPPEEESGEDERGSTWKRSLQGQYDRGQQADIIMDVLLQSCYVLLTDNKCTELCKKYPE